MRTVRAVLAIAVVAALVPAPALAAPPPSDDLTVTELDLATVDRTALRSLPRTMPAAEEDGPFAASSAAQPDVLTRAMIVDPFTVLGVTWDEAPGLEGVTVAYRVRQAGTWSGWVSVGATDVAPDDSGTEGTDATRMGTDPIVVPDADGLQLWAQAERGTVTGLKAVLIDPGTTAAPVAAQAVAGQPAIITRAQWGAKESLVTCEPDLTRSLASAAVHHTAGTNNYSAVGVPGILNGILAYHTRPEADGGRGWCDIGYNFLVDKDGRIYEGRGSIERDVIGVHTGGFNSRTLGVAAIGTYGTSVPVAVTTAVADVIAWKFASHRIFANGTATMTSGGGASKYPAGTVVTFPTIYGHRDAQLTACPGQALYNALGDIRARVALLADATTQATPVGSWDHVSATGSTLRVAGWGLDVGSTQPLQVWVQVGPSTYTTTASVPRPDLAPGYPAEGPNHGFDLSVVLADGRYPVCVTVLNTGAGSDRFLGCAHVTVRNDPPKGAVDTLTADATGLRVRGWALDLDTAASVDVHVYVDGTFARAVTASGSRPDVGAFYGTSGKHGYDLAIPAALGRHTVCVYAINTPVGPNSLLGCRAVDVANTTPVGSLDLARGQVGGITVGGWALDQDSTSPIAVHLYLDGVAVRGVTASNPRPDVAAAYGTTGTHGYAAAIPAAIGRHTVCAYAINTPAGPNPRLGCRDVEVPNTAPIGNLETVTATPGMIAVGGWTLDKDTTTPVTVHVYLDGRAVRSVTASSNRPDVAAAYGTSGTHGFAVTVPAAPGAHEVCVYAINLPTGANPQLGCRTVSL